ncbi:MAG: hypothetical protein KDD22_00005 [Bdellovibrionales bacterium]|nr:hypothetical protein [Bdellovibrionales bacterium]
MYKAVVLFLSLIFSFHFNALAACPDAEEALRVAKKQRSEHFESMGIFTANIYYEFGDYLMNFQEFEGSVSDIPQGEFAPLRGAQEVIQENFDYALMNMDYMKGRIDQTAVAVRACGCQALEADISKYLGTFDQINDLHMKFASEWPKKLQSLIVQYSELEGSTQDLPMGYFNPFNNLIEEVDAFSQGTYEDGAEMEVIEEALESGLAGCHL